MVITLERDTVVVSPVTAIRERFPNPIRAQESHRGLHGYCVGGAFMRFHGFPHEWHDFPSHIRLGGALAVMNPHLDKTTAERFAASILHHNDASDFEGAWQVLEHALAY